MDKERYKYLIRRREEILEEIGPMLEAFHIKDYDYEIDEDGNETLRINNTRIACSYNSTFATVSEVVGYLFVLYWHERYFENKTKTLNFITQSWIKNSKKNQKV